MEMKNTDRIEILEKQVKDLEEYVRKLKADTFITTTSIKLDFFDLISLLIDEYADNKRLKEIRENISGDLKYEDEED